MTNSLLSPIELSQRLNKPLVLSSREIGLNGILLEQHQNSATPGDCKSTGLNVELNYDLNAEKIVRHSKTHFESIKYRMQQVHFLERRLF